MNTTTTQVKTLTTFNNRKNSIKFKQKPTEQGNTNTYTCNRSIRDNI